MNYKIHKDIPIPPSKLYTKAGKPVAKRLTSPTGKFLSQLEVGDCFIIPDENDVRPIIDKLFYPASRIGIRLATEKRPDGIYVWRKN